ncbi:MopE-related protein [Winogradskyella maritima]|uniref:MopE-related protein n=1 Tax=Winogradskyella maritima TaxID=1517766 RepID=A0ABV8AKV4_9FLAO|nr:MopE-related protein [Winogradskyella maritima]
MKNKYLVASIVGILMTFSLSVSAQTPTFDCKFSDAEFGYTNFEGDGFGDWNFFRQNNNDATGGFFVATSNQNGDGDANNDGDINAGNGNSWGMYANSGDFVSATRDFDFAMSVGDSFSIKMDNGFIDGGTVGFGLQNNAGQDLIEFFFKSGESQYTLKGGDALSDTGNTGVAFTDEGLFLRFTLTDSDTFSVEIINEQTQAITVIERDLFFNPDQSVSKIRMFNSTAGSGPQRDAFFNRIEHCRVEDKDRDGENSLTDCDDDDASIFSGAPELCDGLDNDCDGSVDENVTTTFYADGDGDGFGDPNVTQDDCSAPAGFVANADDCDDSKDNVYPNAPELCDGLDNDCDGSVDEDVTTTFYADGDGDGFGDPNVTQDACSVPSGFVDKAGDCDDNDDTVYPNAPELCDGLDNDCDGSIDEDVTTTFYADADGDGFGDPNVTQEACSVPSGFVDKAGDCDDNDDTVYPNALELCDGLDNDCDGSVDEDVTTTFYADADGDGFGDPNVSQEACSEPVGFVANADDCNDSNDTVYPNAPELCDGLDNNCDGSADEDVTTTFYADADGDGFGDPNVTQEACSEPAGFVANADDCDDSNDTVYPNAPELCDGLDNDCDGSVDEDVTTTFYADADGDGFGDPNATQDACSVPSGFVTNADDCDDSNDTVYPNAPELCDGLDNDCDGFVPEYELNAASISNFSLPNEPQDINTVIMASATVSTSGTFSAEISWGDGVTTVANVDGNQVSGTHNYAEAGVYEARIDVTNQCGLVSSAIFQYVVIYDPNGGFVTGGGWITSPEGALVDQPQLSGKATFGFVSKYKRGQSIPDGNTTFKFNAGNFNFKSTSYDWLIVAGNKGQFKGNGTINNQGDYKFILTANDKGSDGDTFRIKIWDSNGGGLVYDNQLGISDSEDASTVIGGGQIIVHKPKKNNTSRNENESNGIDAEMSLNPSIDLTLSPNPASNQFKIHGLATGLSYTISIYDTLGKRVFFSNKYNDSTVALDNSIPKGLYIVRVVQGEANKTFKLIKQD